MSLTITTPDGSRLVRQARVRQDRQNRARSFEQQRTFDSELEDAKVVVLGDGGVEPSPLVVDVYVQEGQNNITGATVQQLINEAKNATSVTTVRGTRLVDGILSHTLTNDGRMLTLSLAFNPTKGSYE